MNSAETSSRQRVRTALEHKQPDRIPIDFGATATSGMHVSCVDALRRRYGLDRRPVKVAEPYQMLGEIEADLLAAMGLDVVALPPARTMFGFANDNWKPFRAPWGQDLLVPGEFNTTIECDGSLLMYPQGDTSVAPCARMPAGGFFFDSIPRQEPIEDDRLDPKDNLEEFTPLPEADLRFSAAAAQRLAAGDRALAGGIGGTALGDIALVPAPFLKRPKGIRDVTEWYISTVTRQDYLHEVFARQTDIALANLERFRVAMGERLDVLFVCGTDFGTQTSSFCSTATFRALYLPYYRKLNDWIHKHTSWKTFKHSCGAVEPFIPLFIEAGFDILNPVQCSATGMDARLLKERYGERIAFWGGGVDTQKTLAFGRPQEVRRETLERCEIFAPGGGFVFNAVHNVQAQTPVENIAAMLDAVHEFNGTR